MKIAYRRMSGTIGFTEHETGTRGLWLEKRNSLVAELERRGHQVDFVNRMTKFSRLACVPEFGSKTHDLLMVEFGSSNASFYKDDLARTQVMVEQHKGPIVFLCDDPDLPYLWKTVTKASQWVAWHNATRPQAFGGQPLEVRSFDAPFASLMSSQLPRRHGSEWVYIGRPLGRKKGVLTMLEARLSLVVCGRAKEWADYEVAVHEPPTQADRRDFYSQKKGCITLADAKHKRLGWRTGRAYHALFAGTPVVIEADHEGIAQGFAAFTTPQDLRGWDVAWQDEATRAAHWVKQLEAVKKDRAILEATFKAAGL